MKSQRNVSECRKMSYSAWSITLAVAGCNYLVIDETKGHVKSLYETNFWTLSWPSWCES